MANPLFGAMSNSSLLPANMSNMLQQFKSNPMQFLLQKRLNVPQNLPINDPNAILNHLLSTGQISQQQINQAYRMAQMFK